MPSVEAKRLCPDLVFVAGDMKRYAAESRRIFEIFRSYSPSVEGLSLDEAFLDLTGTERLLGPPGDVGERLRREVREKTSLADLGRHRSDQDGREDRERRREAGRTCWRSRPTRSGASWIRFRPARSGASVPWPESVWRASATGRSAISRARSPRPCVLVWETGASRSVASRAARTFARWSPIARQSRCRKKTPSIATSRIGASSKRRS